MYTEEDCQRIIQQTMEQSPGIYHYMEEQKAYARRHGEVRDMFGRRRLLPDIHSKDPRTRAEAERQAINFPVQCGATNIMKKAMGNIWSVQEYRHQDWVLQVHDEVVGEFIEEEVEELAKEIQKVIEDSVQLSIPVLASVKVGKRLGDLHGL